MPQVIMMSLDKNMDLRTDGQFDMTNLSTEKIMNKITKITKKKKKKIKLIKPKEETITIEPTNFKYPNRCSKIWNVEKQKEEDDEDEDSDCVAHPVYNCDGGCGTIMGSDDDCKRICDDCEEDSDDEEEEIELKVEPPINLWDSLLEQQQKDILKSQSVWKIYFGAVLQDIREPNWREEEKEKKKCRECEVVITKDNIYEPEDFHENCDLCDKCGDYYKECVVCDEWTVEDECYRDKDGDAINLCNVCGDSEYAEIEENVEKINQFVKNYERGEYIGFYSTEIDTIMKFINKFHKRC